MAMRHFGFKKAALGALLLGMLLLQGCLGAPVRYSDEQMGPLTTLSRVTMDAVWGMYVGETLPENLDEAQIKQVVAARGRPVEGLEEALDTYDMRIVTHDRQMEAIFWDPKTTRKLHEDMRCTRFVDFKAWEVQASGSEPTLDWGICGP